MAGAHTTGDIAEALLSGGALVIGTLRAGGGAFALRILPAAAAVPLVTASSAASTWERKRQREWPCKVPPDACLAVMQKLREVE